MFLHVRVLPAATMARILIARYDQEGTLPDEADEGVDIPLVVTGEDEVPILFVNFAAVGHEKSEFILTFGQMTQPLLLGSPEERVRQAKQLGAVPLRIVARLGMTHQRMAALAQALNENLSRYEQGKGLSE